MAKKHTCIVLDDEFVCRKSMESLLKNFSNLNLIGSYESTSKAQKDIMDKQVDIAFLDIMLPGESGMDLAKILKTKGTEIIFTTSNTELAIQAYNLDACDYLTKPIEYERLEKSVEKAIQLASKRKEEQEVYKIAGINNNSVTFIEKDRDYLRIFHEDGVLRVKKSLRKLIDELETDNIVRIHKSFAVNKDKITKIDRDHVFIEARKLPLSRNGRNNLVGDLKVL